MEKGLVITPNNEIFIQEFDRPLFESIGKAVDGWIEIVHPVYLDAPYVMIVNEEGLLKELPENITGSCLYGTFFHGSPIVGNIVIMCEGYTDEGPDIIGIPDYEVDGLYARFKNRYELKGVKNHDR